VADNTYLSPPRISTVARYVTIRVRNTSYLVFGIILLMIGILTIIAAESSKAYGVGALLCLAGIVLMIIYIYFPSTKPYIVGASENVYICHHCGRLLIYDEAIILPTSENPQYLPAILREHNILVKILLGVAIFILLIVKLFALIIDIALKTKDTEQSITAKIDEMIARISTVQPRPPQGCEIMVLGLTGPLGYTLEVQILKCGYYYTVHCVECLKKYHPKLYEVLTKEGEGKAIVVSNRVKKEFLVATRKFAMKSDEEFLERVMGAI